jgi:L-seryl-tRNA(Ser) seleniumtransferase
VTGAGDLVAFPGPDARRSVPRTDAVLADPLLASALTRFGQPRVRAAVRAAQDRARRGELAPAEVAAAALGELPARSSSLTPVLNVSGAILHTNLGRAVLSDRAKQAVQDAAGATDVEFDLATGRRARRGRGVLAALRAALPDAGDVLVVNNGAAALLLAVTALCPPNRPEVVWSRGQLVEIGDGFRLPDLVASAGARIREVGTTNRTTVTDYVDALGDQTGAVLSVHPSNFVVSGFASTPGTRELAAVLHGQTIPLVVDVGSGLLGVDPILPDEPDITTALRAGADLVTASADKLLGGPQAGLIAGRSDLVERIRRHPLARALRVDKLTLAALEASVAGPPTPTRQALHIDLSDLRRRTTEIVDALTAQGITAEAVPSVAVVGGGGAPGVELPSWALALPVSFAAPLRAGSSADDVPPVVGRVAAGRLLLDLRTVAPHQDETVRLAVEHAAARTRDGC